MKTNILNHKHLPSVLTGLSLGGLVVTVYLAIKDTEKQLKSFYLNEEIRNRPLTDLERIRIFFKYYTPTLYAGTLTAFLMTSAHIVQVRREALITTTYLLTDQRFRDYRTAVIETVSKKQLSKITEQQDTAQMSKTEPTKELLIVGSSESVLFDTLSGRYFKGEIEKIRAAFNKFNEELLTDMEKTLNELYDLMGLEATRSGEVLGWNVENGLLEVSFMARIAHDKPCIALHYTPEPQKTTNVW